MKNSTTTGLGTWRVLTRQDLRGFDEASTQIILDAMRLGGAGRFSSNHHVIIRAPYPSESTMAVSSKLSSGNRARQNVLAQFRRMFPSAAERLAELDAEEAGQVRANGTTGGVLVTPAFGAAAANGHGELKCPVCPATFHVEGARYTHVHKEHRVCPEPGCQYASDSARAITLHGYRSHTPYKATCAVCKKEFTAGSGAAKWCSDECRREGKRLSQEAYRKKKRTNALKAAAGRKGAAARWHPEQAEQQAQPAHEPAPVISLDVRGSDLTPAEMVKAIRSVLGQDDRVAELEAEVQRLTKMNADLQAKLDLMKEALGA